MKSLDFIITGLPRSGTTWVSNWLTTDKSLCVHDPLNFAHYEDIESSPLLADENKRYVRRGICCTAAYNFPEWVNGYRCQKAVITRDIAAVRKSFHKSEIGALDHYAEAKLALIKAPRIKYEDLFNPMCAKVFWDHIMDPKDSWLEFDITRHMLLSQMKIEPIFDKIEPNEEVRRRIQTET